MRRRGSMTRWFGRLGNLGITSAGKSAWMAPIRRCFLAKTTRLAVDIAHLYSAQVQWRAGAPSPTHAEVCGVWKSRSDLCSVSCCTNPGSNLTRPHWCTCSSRIALAGSALPSRSLQTDPYTDDEVWSAMSTVELALEVCASRFTCAVPLAVVAADFGNHHALVRGTPVPTTQIASLHPGNKPEPATTGWSCQAAGILVSASSPTSTGKMTPTEEVLIEPPAVSHDPLQSL